MASAGDPQPIMKVFYTPVQIIELAHINDEEEQQTADQRVLRRSRIVSVLLIVCAVLSLGFGIGSGVVDAIGLGPSRLFRHTGLWYGFPHVLFSGITIVFAVSLLCKSHQQGATFYQKPVVRKAFFIMILLYTVVVLIGLVAASLSAVNIAKADCFLGYLVYGVWAAVLDCTLIADGTLISILACAIGPCRILPNAAQRARGRMAQEVVVARPVVARPAAGALVAPAVAEDFVTSDEKPLVAHPVEAPVADSGASLLATQSV